MLHLHLYAYVIARVGGIHFGFQDDVTINFDANTMACNGTTTYTYTFCIQIEEGEHTIVAITNNGFYASGRGDKMGDGWFTHTHTQTHMARTTRKWACPQTHTLTLHMTQSKCYWDIVGFVMYISWNHLNVILSTPFAMLNFPTIDACIHLCVTRRFRNMHIKISNMLKAIAIESFEKYSEQLFEESSTYSLCFFLLLLLFSSLPCSLWFAPSSPPTSQKNHTHSLP